MKERTRQNELANIGWRGTQNERMLASVVDRPHIPHAVAAAGCPRETTRAVAARFGATNFRMVRNEDGGARCVADWPAKYLSGH
jgi:hypothetical protein